VPLEPVVEFATVMPVVAVDEVVVPFLILNPPAFKVYEVGEPGSLTLTV
jgi:hypothetical protein